jgi:hypothetical protein
VEDAGKDGILPAPNSHPANAVHHDGRHFGHGRIYCTTNSQRMSIDGQQFIMRWLLLLYLG